MASALDAVHPKGKSKKVKGNLLFPEFSRLLNMADWRQKGQMTWHERLCFKH